MNETIDYNAEKDFSKRIMEKDEKLIEIRDFKVGHKDGNCGTYEKAQKLREDARKMRMSMFSVIFVKLIAKTKELMRRHDAKLFEVDDN